MEAVEDGEDICNDQTVDDKVEEAKNPGATQEAHEDTNTFHIREYYVLAALIAHLDLVEEHGVDGKSEEPDVAEDNNDCRDDETEDKVIVHSEPTEIFGSITAPNRVVLANVVF